MIKSECSAVAAMRLSIAGIVLFKAACNLHHLLATSSLIIKIRLSNQLVSS